ncbi:hypothetical protein CGZ80_03820 [Rhodopirellula sp. MGV]|nr:hypothetical protein CGZ80_03820 [Rhodopirellula sp. MGV]
MIQHSETPSAIADGVSFLLNLNASVLSLSIVRLGLKRVLGIPVAALLLLGTSMSLHFDESTQSTETSKPAIAIADGVSSDTKPTFVGRDICKECHQTNYDLHAHHGHKSTFYLADDPKIAELFDGKTYDAGEPYGTYHYHTDEDGLYVTLPERFGDRPFRLDYALGSPEGAITLLSLIPDQQGNTIAIEHRASWFNATQKLGPTPQEAPGPMPVQAEAFGLKHQGNVMRKCVYCHTTAGEIENQTVVGLVANVNCEKCHGPASEHVRLARQMENPPKYSVGKADWDVESEIQLCGDCHRLPMTISRSELREYPDELVRFQPVGILRSRCYLESERQLGCSTCHNPHESVETVPMERHVKKCVSCHLESESDHVACPVSPKTGCIECHMPAKQLPGIHLDFHDHWIRVHEPQ